MSKIFFFVFQVTLDEHKSKAVEFEIIWCSSPDSIKYKSYFSLPELIEFPTEVPGQNAYAYFYLPSNPVYQCSLEEKPPLLVKSHGMLCSIFSYQDSHNLEFFHSIYGYKIKIKMGVFILLPKSRTHINTKICIRLVSSYTRCNSLSCYAIQQLLLELIFGELSSSLNFFHTHIMHIEFHIKWMLRTIKSESHVYQFFKDIIRL